MEGLVTAMSFVFDSEFESAREILTGGLSPFSYNAMAHPDAVVLYNYNAALVVFASIITKEHGTPERPLSGPKNGVKELMKCFAHLKSDKWGSPQTQDFTEFNNQVYPGVTWPGTKHTSSSPSKRTLEGTDTQTVAVKKSRSTKPHSTFKQREAKRQAAVPAAAASLSLSGLSLVGSGVTAGSGVGQVEVSGQRPCVSTLCGFVGVKYHGTVVRCKHGSLCKYGHAASINDVRKSDALFAIGRMKSSTSDGDTIKYLTEAEVLYAARST
jgi:hypothetical protein